MVRSLAAVALLGLLALLGVWSGFTMYGLTSTYADPAGSAAGNLVASGGLVVVLVLLLLGLLSAAVAGARPRTRRPVAVVAAVVVVLALGGVVVGNQVGFHAKQTESATPPHCGIQNPSLHRTWRSIEHPGYFGGGSESRTGCSFMLTAPSADEALATYATRLAASGWQVTRSPRHLSATRDGYRFSARLREPISGSTYLQVGLRSAR